MNKIDRLFFEQTVSSGLPKKNDTVLVCVSGGSDSMALLHLFLTIQSPFSLSLGIAHVNHGWRKTESENEALFVQQVAKECSIPFFPRLVHPDEWRGIPGTGLEEKGRFVRCQFFYETAKKNGFRLIALGHTQDDLLETLLFNLIRGTSPEGFAGLLPIFDPDSSFFRPLLSFTKNTLLSYLASKNIAYKTDKSNMDEKFTRNKIRNQVVPLLMTINPAVGSAFLRFKEILADDEGFILELVSKFLTASATIINEEIRIPRAEYLLLSRCLQFHLIREIRKKVTLSPRDFYFSQIISIHQGIMIKEDFCYQDKNMGVECRDGLIVFFNLKRKDER